MKDKIISKFYAEAVTLTNEEVKIIELASKYTNTNYEIVTNDEQEKIIDGYTLICAIEDLLYEVDRKEDKIEELDSKLEDYICNWK